MSIECLGVVRNSPTLYPYTPVDDTTRYEYCNRNGLSYHNKKKRLTDDTSAEDKQLPLAYLEPKKNMDVRGDGNCFYRCIAATVSGKQDDHEPYRQMVVKEAINLQSQNDDRLLRLYVPVKSGSTRITWQQYLTEHRPGVNGNWTSDIEIRLMAKALGMDIYTYIDNSTIASGYWARYGASLDNAINADNALYIKWVSMNHYNVVVSVIRTPTYIQQSQALHQSYTPPPTTPMSGTPPTPGSGNGTSGTGGRASSASRGSNTPTDTQSKGQTGWATLMSRTPSTLGSGNETNRTRSTTPVSRTPPTPGSDRTRPATPMSRTPSRVSSASPRSNTSTDTQPRSRTGSATPQSAASGDIQANDSQGAIEDPPTAPDAQPSIPRINIYGPEPESLETFEDRAVRNLLNATEYRSPQPMTTPYKRPSSQPNEDLFEVDTEADEAANVLQDTIDNDPLLFPNRTTFEATGGTPERIDYTSPVQLPITQQPIDDREGQTSLQWLTQELDAIIQSSRTSPQTRGTPHQQQTDVSAPPATFIPSTNDEFQGIMPTATPVDVSRDVGGSHQPPTLIQDMDEFTFGETFAGAFNALNSPSGAGTAPYIYEDPDGTYAYPHQQQMQDVQGGPLSNNEDTESTPSPMSAMEGVGLPQNLDNLVQGLFQNGTYAEGVGFETDDVGQQPDNEELFRTSASAGRTQVVTRNKPYMTDDYVDIIEQSMNTASVPTQNTSADASGDRFVYNEDAYAEMSKKKKQNLQLINLHKQNCDANMKVMFKIFQSCIDGATVPTAEQLQLATTTFTQKVYQFLREFQTPYIPIQYDGQTYNGVSIDKKNVRWCMLIETVQRKTGLHPDSTDETMAAARATDDENFRVVRNKPNPGKEGRVSYSVRCNRCNDQKAREKGYPPMAFVSHFLQRHGDAFGVDDVTRVCFATAHVKKNDIVVFVPPPVFHIIKKHGRNIKV